MLAGALITWSLAALAAVVVLTTPAAQWLERELTALDPDEEVDPHALDGTVRVENTKPHQHNRKGIA